MTWNIAAGHGDLARIAQVIRDVEADIVTLQEVDVHWHERSHFVDQAAALGASLGMNTRFAPIYSLPGVADAPLREFGVAILSRHRFIEFRNHRLTRLSTQSSATTPESLPGFPEALVDVNGFAIRVFTTHLDYRADPAVRTRQVSETRKILELTVGPTVLTGDLNAPPDSVELAPLLERLNDVWPAGPDSGFTYPANAPARRIDYVLVSRDLRASHARVVLTEDSDHRPVIADISR